MASTRMRNRRPAFDARRSRPWWRQPGNWAVIAIAAVAVSFVVAMIWRQVPPKADIDQAAIAAAEVRDPRMKEIEGRFRCPCGNCGHLELADCSCEVPGGALEMKTVIARLLSEGATKDSVVTTISDRFGGLKPDSAKSGPSQQGQESNEESDAGDIAVGLHSSHENLAEPDAAVRVASVFDCPCGNCALTLVDCTCDHANGSVEVMAFIRDRLSQGLREADVIDAVAQTYEARRSPVASTVAGVRTTDQ